MFSSSYSFDNIKFHPLLDEHNVNDFDSGNDKLNEYIFSDAKEDQENFVSKTYLAYKNSNLIGYFTLVADTINVAHIDYEDKTDDVEERRRSKYPAIKLARLAVDKKYQKNGIGTYLLKVAILKTLKLSDEVGCRYLTLDAKNKSIDFYMKKGLTKVKNKKYDDKVIFYYRLTRLKGYFTN